MHLLSSVGNGVLRQAAKWINILPKMFNAKVEAEL